MNCLVSLGLRGSNTSAHTPWPIHGYSLLGRSSSPQSGKMTTLIMVLGPTGVGKSALRAKVEQMLTMEMLQELEAPGGDSLS